MMAAGSKALRRIELAFWVIGLVLIGVALESTFARWNYQQQQERALFDGGPAPSPTKVAVATPVRAAAPVAEVSQVTKRKSVRHVPAPDPLAIGRIEIPRLGLKAIVKQGDDEKTLARAVGLIPGSSFPGEPGNIVLAGHRDTFFWPLQDIQVGDQIRFVSPRRTYSYSVQSVHVVNPDDTSVLASHGVENLTLVTCYPFRYVGPAPERFIVSATRVN